MPGHLTTEDHRHDQSRERPLSAVTASALGQSSVRVRPEHVSAITGMRTVAAYFLMTADKYSSGQILLATDKYSSQCEKSGLIVPQAVEKTWRRRPRRLDETRISPSWAVRGKTVRQGTPG